MGSLFFVYKGADDKAEFGVLALSHRFPDVIIHGEFVFVFVDFVWLNCYAT